MKRKILHMTVGLPYSGKSTWARLSGYPIVCPDEIRLALHGQRFCPAAEQMVWTIAKLMVKSLFGAGHDNVVLDATNITESRRKDWHSAWWDRAFIVMRTQKSVCMQRAKSAGDKQILPVIENMYDRYEQITELERKLGVAGRNNVKIRSVAGIWHVVKEQSESRCGMKIPPVRTRPFTGREELCQECLNYGR